MTVINIPFGVDFEKSFVEFILSNFSNISPNFAKIKVITPSKDTSKNLKLAFAKEKVLMPKIISITDIADNSRVKQCSSFKAKLLLYEIAKKHLSSFGVNGIFNYLDNFLELEKLTAQNNTDFVSSLKSAERLIENMASHLQNSLVSFLKIHLDWHVFKAENDIKMQDDVNFAVLHNLREENFEDYEAVFLAYFQGSNHLQIELAKHISSLKNGFVVLNGEEQDDFAGKLMKNFAKELKMQVKQVETKPYEVIHYMQEYENSLSLVNGACLRAVSILNAENKAKVGFVCYDFHTGLLLSKKFEELGFNTTTVFIESMQENPIFRLFISYLEHGDLSNYLSFIKNPKVNFEKTEAENFEKSIRSPNLKTKRPFEILNKSSFSKPKNLFDFLQFHFDNFSKILTLEVLESDDFLDFSSFIESLKNEVESFALEDEKFYTIVLKNFAKSLKETRKNSENIFILSPIEARAKKFDVLFLTDVTDKNLPNPPSSNKILNHHLQKLLKIDEKKDAVEWLDFASFLLSARQVFCLNARRNFEGKGENMPSVLLLYAMEKYNFQYRNEVFYTQKPISCEFSPPEFKAELISSLSPTSFEMLLNKPFDFYVKKVLGLNLENEINYELEKRYLGIIIHDAIEKFYQNGESIVLTCKKKLYETGYNYEFILYEEHFKKIQKFFEEKVEKSCNFAIMEKVISIKESFQNREITLHAKPDRIEFYDDEIRVIDYKVYSVEIGKNDVLTGKKPQLPFQAYIISRLYPDFKGKIRLSYYNISLNKFPDVVLESEIEWNGGFEIVKNSIDELFLNLQTFFCKDGESSFYKHLSRKL
jgi:RecB family exonuclease